MVNYSVADSLIRIKNSYRAGHRELTIPYSKTIYSLCKILKDEGFIESVKTSANKKEIILNLKFVKRKPVISDVKIISKPSLRVYVKKKSIPKVYGGLGITIVSTPKGLMTGSLAKKKNLGGELLCKVW